MTLYHFTAERFLTKIEKQGLTKGKLVKTINPPTFIDGYQWLTRNSSFNQSWSRGTGRLPYKRNEARLTIEFPEFALDKIKPWSQVKFLTPMVAAELSRYGDPENWVLFVGNVPADWIKKVDFNVENISATL